MSVIRRSVELRKAIEPVLPKPWDVDLSDEDNEAYYVGVRETLKAVEKIGLTDQLAGAIEAERTRIAAWLRKRAEHVVDSGANAALVSAADDLATGGQ